MALQNAIFVLSGFETHSSDHLERSVYMLEETCDLTYCLSVAKELLFCASLCDIGSGTEQILLFLGSANGDTAKWIMWLKEEGSDSFVCKSLTLMVIVGSSLQHLLALPQPSPFSNRTLPPQKSSMRFLL